MEHTVKDQVIWIHSIQDYFPFSTFVKNHCYDLDFETYQKPKYIDGVAMQLD
jgi:hypothetical protein